ncbi:hypothetical protein AB6B38_02970 [Glycocaulis abyssi]|uniref:Uncharacterized protein n=1 Tax=Glycocaulis abyssi TaxID=1433403 RepID=A0ABV9NEM1_9PROT
MARRGSRYSLERVQARARRVRHPREAGLPRRLIWWGWQALAALARPAVFAVLVALAGFSAFDGMRHLNPVADMPDRAGRVNDAFASLAPDAATAASIWSNELETAMQPRAGLPPDNALAASLLAAFEPMAGRERFSSMVWAELHARSSPEAEAILRALPVWVRTRELESAWNRQMEHARGHSGRAAAAGLAPAAVRTRLERAGRLYDAVQPFQAAFFAGHEDGALNLALLPGLSAGAGELWLQSDQMAALAHCPAGEPLECALARMGRDAGAGQGARLLRAALLAGQVDDAFRSELQSANEQTLHAIASELGAVARYTSNIDAIRLTALLETPQDAARLRRLSLEAGPRTLALAHFHGRGALALDRGEGQASPVTAEAWERFVLAGVFAALALGIVLAALTSAFSVRVTGRAGLGQRIDIAMRELLLGRKV